ncbi:unnamed protein product [Fraxinus pennsylvanica]|uniref:Uncharacterized protein n=1 Tax=Fraxinus pennsylvanica TaxID=56036 RepID=A0AAD2DI47_9LAMI|nr:unnamed protein product [Fraxinus pennsylvanica]
MHLDTILTSGGHGVLAFYKPRGEGQESYYSDERDSDDGFNEISSKDSPNKAQHLGATILASKFAANTRRGVVQKVQFADTVSSSLKMPKLFKPEEPDFSEEV